MLDDDDDELDELPVSAFGGNRTDRGHCKRVIRYLDGKTNNDMRKNYVERLFENARAVVKGHKG